jgi:tyrosine-protein kinase Etk/Wzc
VEQRNIAGQMNAYRSRVESAPQHESELAQMTRDYTATQAQYQEMLEKKQTALLAQRFEKMSREVLFTIVDPARRPLKPYSPQKARIVLLGILGGLTVGIGLAFLAEHMDTAFEGLDDFQRSCDLPVIATIPAISRSLRKHQAKAPLPTVTNPKSVVAEQYRVLATKMQVGPAVGSKVIAIMSSAGGEGKTLTSVNLALALATMTTGRVLLIDCDLRRPRIHEYLGFEVFERQGLGELLGNPSAEPGSFVRRFRDPRTRRDVFVIPGSSLGTDAVGLLSSQRTREVFTTLRREFDVIILDSPPILPIADSLVLAGLSDEILMIVRARQTPRELFEQAVESLDPKILRGVVLNDVDYQYSRYAYAYRYYEKTYLAQN